MLSPRLFSFAFSLLALYRSASQVGFASFLAEVDIKNGSLEPFLSYFFLLCV